MANGRGAVVMTSSGQVLSSGEQIHDASPFLKVRVETVRLPDGRRIPDYYQLDMPSFACILAETADGRTIVYKQYRHGSRRTGRLSGRTSRTRRSSLRRRPTISESTRPLGSTRHCIPSEAKPSAVPPPPSGRFGGASSADAANPRDRFYTTGFGNASADPLRDRGMASLARTGRLWKWQRSEPIAPSRVISFWASPKSELIPLSSRINSAVNPLLIRCYGGRVSPVRAEFIAGSRRGERGFATISLPCGFCSKFRGGRSDRLCLRSLKIR